MEAFYQLEQLLMKLDNGQRMVIFIDELPWMDTPRSRFLSAFENFWNGWCNGRDNVMLVVCGSATSWMLSSLSRSKGGLYGRLTDEIKVYPFTLKECEAYFEHENIEISRYDIVQSYMVFGGIPYYLSYFRKGYINLLSYISIFILPLLNNWYFPAKMLILIGICKHFFFYFTSILLLLYIYFVSIILLTFFLPQ